MAPTTEPAKSNHLQRATTFAFSPGWLLFAGSTVYAMFIPCTKLCLAWGLSVCFSLYDLCLALGLSVFWLGELCWALDLSVGWVNYVGHWVCLFVGSVNYVW